LWAFYTSLIRCIFNPTIR